MDRLREKFIWNETQPGLSLTLSCIDSRHKKLPKRLNFCSVKTLLLCFLSPLYCSVFIGKGHKGKAVSLQTWSGPEGSRKLRFSDIMTTAQDGGKIVSLTHRPPRKCSWYSFLLEAELTPGAKGNTLFYIWLRLEGPLCRMLLYMT